MASWLVWCARRRKSESQLGADVERARGLTMVPETANMAASLPANLAIRSCNSLVA